jgi:hypothetical protein
MYSLVSDPLSTYVRTRAPESLSITKSIYTYIEECKHVFLDQYLCQVADDQGFGYRGKYRGYRLVFRSLW